MELGLLSCLSKAQGAELSLVQLSEKPADKDHPQYANNNGSNGSRKSRDQRKPHPDCMDWGSDPSNRATTWDPDLIARLMRVITAIGVSDEVGQERYASNPVTDFFAKSGIEAGVKFLYV